MSLFSKLFGLKVDDAPAKAPSQEHGGYRITATPMKVDGQFQVCGTIDGEVNGQPKHYRFVRADKCSSLDEALDLTFQKGRLVIDQLGASIFD